MIERCSDLSCSRSAARAALEQRMLLTLDVEFADLRKYPPGSHSRIVLFRPLSISPLSVNRLVGDFVRSSDVRLEWDYGVRRQR
jgi:predicted nuclease of predicted toxin-antitoxin system